jgi:murein DD-endopeptidase MepM/ murein hydrolase activator NlpD
MAGITYKGQVGSTGTATGPHLHVYVKDLAKGTYLDPATIRSPLMGLRIGEKRLPALIKTPEGSITFNPEAGISLTSKYGPRSAPTAGASTFHRGEDWALPEGTPIFYEGAGQYKPLANQGGYGNLSTFITGDNKYEIGLGHMKTLGKPGEIAGTQQQSSNTTDASQASALFGALLNAMQPRPKTVQEQLKESLLASAMSPRRSSSPLMQAMYSGPMDEIIYG